MLRPFNTEAPPTDPTCLRPPKWSPSPAHACNFPDIKRSVCDSRASTGDIPFPQRATMMPTSSTPRVGLLLLVFVTAVGVSTGQYPRPTPTYGAPKPCYPSTVTEYDTVTETSTVVETSYTTVEEEVVTNATEYTTVTETEVETLNVTINATVVETEVVQINTTDVVTVNETVVVTNTSTATVENTVTVTEIKIQEIEVTKCPSTYPRPTPSYHAPAPSYHTAPPPGPYNLPTASVQSSFGAFKGYGGFKGFDFKGYDPFQ
ncbi:mucin-2-like isoform X1 [Macrobrachium nipponense]|uniref:mucin-2-like isoform X1 n=1 Tax=Macrobrachium nipponense TaxID=159736 RepID=UPI0030C7F787